MSPKFEFLTLIRLLNEYDQTNFYALNPERKRRYTEEQKDYAIDLVARHGVRATSRSLGLYRRTLQGWLQKRGIKVKRYPPWMAQWAAKKRQRRNWLLLTELIKAINNTT